MTLNYPTINKYISGFKDIPVVSDFNTQNCRPIVYHLYDAKDFFNDNYCVRSIYYKKSKKSKAVLLNKLYTKEFQYRAHFSGYYIIVYEHNTHFVANWIDNINKSISFILEPKNIKS